jgi:hypothetical protein
MRHEMEQALCITPGETKQLLQVHASLNVVQLCGPIVEIFDGRLQFVHFTVKEQVLASHHSEKLQS